VSPAVTRSSWVQAGPHLAAILVMHWLQGPCLHTIGEKPAVLMPNTLTRGFHASTRARQDARDAGKRSAALPLSAARLTFPPSEDNIACKRAHTSSTATPEIPSMRSMLSESTDREVLQLLTAMCVAPAAALPVMQKGRSVQPRRTSSPAMFANSSRSRPDSRQSSMPSSMPSSRPSARPIRPRPIRPTASRSSSLSNRRCDTRSPQPLVSLADPDAPRLQHGLVEC
jgi:hypothetical protein